MEPLCLPSQANYVLNKYFLLVIATVSKVYSRLVCYVKNLSFSFPANDSDI